MALEAVVFPQDPFGYSVSKDLYSLFGGNWSCEFGLEKLGDGQQDCYDFLENQPGIASYGDWSTSSPNSIVPTLGQLNQSNLSSEVTASDGLLLAGETQIQDSSKALQSTSRRRRSKSRKNKEEIENQRMTHIAVERNRRKQMNEYLSVLRSLMPDSYVQRGDQASVIGGAINFVKQLEQQVQFLSSQQPDVKGSSDGGSCMPFSECFSFPQYSTSSSVAASLPVAEECQPSVADIEVAMVESHANIKVRSRRRPKQLLKMVAGLQTMRLTILHLNLTTANQIVLYSLSVKVEDDCKLTSGDEIAAALYQLLGRIQEEAILNGSPSSY